MSELEPSSTDATSFTTVTTSSVVSEKSVTSKQTRHSDISLSTISFSEWATLLLGFIGIIGTFIFGTWAIRSYDAAEMANNISNKSLNAALDPHPLQAWNLNNQLLLSLMCSIGQHVSSSESLTPFIADRWLSDR